MSFTMNLNRRHQRLAKRIRCGYTWPCDKDHRHSCQTFKGHTGPVHVCACGGSTKKRLTSRLCLTS